MRDGLRLISAVVTIYMFSVLVGIVSHKRDNDCYCSECMYGLLLVCIRRNSQKEILKQEQDKKHRQASRDTAVHRCDLYLFLKWGSKNSTQLGSTLDMKKRVASRSGGYDGILSAREQITRPDEQRWLAQIVVGHKSLDKAKNICLRRP